MRVEDFMRRSLPALACVLVAGCTSGKPVSVPLASLETPPRAAAAGDLSGRYDFAGRLRDVEGVALEIRLSEHMSKYSVLWYRGERKQAEGMAVRIDDTLAVVQGKTPRDFDNDYVDLGIAIYQMDGVDLRGARILEREPGFPLRIEILRPIEGKQDRYAVLDGAGQIVPQQEVKISRNGDAYLLAWYDPRLSFVGTGVRLGDRLVFGLSDTNLPSVMAFCRAGDELRGLGVRNSGERPTRYFMVPERALPDDLGSGDCAQLLPDL